MPFHNPFFIVWQWWYLFTQYLVSLVFQPPKPPRNIDKRKERGHIAVIGAGLTGISSAAHFIAHGFEVTIFDATSEVGGIWSRVNSTSALQLNSFLYRFFPSVKWRETYPARDEILSQMRAIWKGYDLESRTMLNSRVTKVLRHNSSTSPDERGHANWLVYVNDSNTPVPTVFDALCVTVGTCGDPNMIKMPGQDKFSGKIVHSSELDKLEKDEFKGKSIVIVGGGASAVEAAETAISKGADKTVSVVARDDKWIIPRNFVIDTLLALEPFGRETPFARVPEFLIRKLHYRGLADLSPIDRGIFFGTPIVNNAFLSHIRKGNIKYYRGDLKKIDGSKAIINQRARGTKPGDDPIDTVDLDADIVVLATGFKRPSVDFLPKDLFPSSVQGDYKPPNLYIQNFSVAEWNVLNTNSAYMNAIGTVGHFHIGIYARILLVFLMDPATRPLPKEMMLWVDFLRWFKSSAPGGALSFFTYMEMTIWLTGFHFLRAARLKWIFFVLFGWGVGWQEVSKLPVDRKVPQVDDSQNSH
ncbi:FAD/NAD(P)-binding domain-containing protein [Atractiella rhizophila]|nr:FAD/NAD(P)-binding domain-containing protein [Atractiella rhizophila]